MKQEGSEYNYYVRGKEGNTLAVFLDNTSNNVLISILGEGGDPDKIGTGNLGQQMWSNWGLTHYFYLKDHLGSIKMALNQMGGVDSYNDYYPFGMQMPGRNGVASADARYKFTGKERDSETNLDYFGARYYDSWRGQWGQVDPLENKYPEWGSYNYVLDNPIRLIDSTGNQPGGGDDPTTFLTQYIQNEYNSLWNTGSHIVYNFTYNILPTALDAVSYGTVTWAPEVSLLASSASAGLTITKNLSEGNGIFTKENLESTATTVIGAVVKTKAIQVGATVLQLGFDAINSSFKEKSTENLNFINHRDIRDAYKQSFNHWVAPADNTYISQDNLK